MKPQASGLQAVQSEELFHYPIATRERLRNHFFLTFHHRRWLNSDFRNLADLDVRGVALDLFCAAQDQAPVGTLPTNDQLIARLVDVSLETWRGLAARSIPPLTNWQRCVCDDGEVRLYHPVVLEIVLDALGRKEQDAEKRANDKARKRLKALPEQMMRAGLRKQATEDEAFVLRLDEHLLEHYDGEQRRPATVRRALEDLDLQDQRGA
ncbi:hypothetical protein SAMN06273572_10232 [Monaibacterium marinum]|uniref:Uncharacterized protein n=1 Tax=Pontivivens marinum TaxID=1690039 RepID=A0A2C9CPR0_9RHOB|nr:hypothetical protein [Monaibacterium marinum]SOH93356.1 hypothetical protein SAMN06273572_10232 [Monaibacterium marinum]